MKLKFVAYALLAMGSVSAAWAESAGRVIAAVGDVSLERQGKVMALTVGEGVDNGDVLKVGQGGSLQVRFSDESIVALRANSQLRIDDYRFEKSAESDRSFFSLVKGGLRTITGLIGKANKKSYGVQTATATIGIRGTHFVLVACDNDCFEPNGSPMPNGTFGGVTDGRIVVVNEAGEREFGQQEFFHVANRGSLPTRLLAPPPLLNDGRLARSRGASSEPGLASGAGEASTPLSGAPATTTSPQLFALGAPSVVLTVPVTTYGVTQQPAAMAAAGFNPQRGVWPGVTPPPPVNTPSTGTPSGSGTTPGTGTGPNTGGTSGSGTSAGTGTGTSAGTGTGTTGGTTAGTGTSTASSGLITVAQANGYAYPSSYVTTNVESGTYTGAQLSSALGVSGLTDAASLARAFTNGGYNVGYSAAAASYWVYEAPYPGDPAGHFGWHSAFGDTPLTVPTSGIAQYNFVGGTAATDNLGRVGTFSPGNLSMDFTNQQIKSLSDMVMSFPAGAGQSATTYTMPANQTWAMHSGGYVSMQVTCSGCTAPSAWANGRFSGPNAEGYVAAVAVTSMLNNATNAISHAGGAVSVFARQ